MIHGWCDALTAIPFKVRICVLVHEGVIAVVQTQQTAVVPLHHFFVRNVLVAV